MIRPDQIPDEVVEAMWVAHFEKGKSYRAAIAAAINAWPNGDVVGKYDNDDTALLLPLPQEDDA